MRRRQQSNDTPEDQQQRDKHGQDDDSGAETGRKLACPFFKYDRVGHFDCLSFTLKRVKDVKQHIIRKHQGLPAEQNSTPSDNLKNPSGEVDKWFAIWDVLFPHRSRPDSPFIESDVEEAIMMVKEFWEKHADEAIPAVARQVGLQDAMHNSLLPDNSQGHTHLHQASSASFNMPNREVVGSLLQEIAFISRNRTEEGSIATLRAQESGSQQEQQTVIDNTRPNSEESEMSFSAYLLHLDDLEETVQSPLTSDIFEQADVLPTMPWNTEYIQNEAPGMEDSMMSGQEDVVQEPYELNLWADDFIDAQQDLSFVGLNFELKKEE